MSPIMSHGIHPIFLIVTFGVLLAIGSIVWACKARSIGTRVLLILLALVFLLPAGFLFMALNPELVDARFRTYKAFYRDLKVGMTRDEVFAVMDRHYPASGTRQRPTVMADEPLNLGFFMNPEKSREPNCEGIFLTLQNGRVTSIRYSPD